MKVRLFYGEDSANRRLAIESAIEEIGANPLTFDLDEPGQLQAALESLGGSFLAEDLVVWRNAQALKKLTPERLNELTLDRFEDCSHEQLFIEVADEIPKKGKPSMVAFKQCLPAGQEIKLESFPLPLPWRADEHLEWILKLAGKHQLRLGTLLAKQLLLMVGFKPERLLSEIKLLAELKRLDERFALSSSALDHWIEADNVDFEQLVDAHLHKRWDDVCRFARQIEASGMSWPEVVLKLQSASWTALQFISVRGKRFDDVAPLLRTSGGRVAAMTQKFAAVTQERAVALHGVAMGLSATANDETASYMRTNLRLLGAICGCWS